MKENVAKMKKLAPAIFILLLSTGAAAQGAVWADGNLIKRVCEGNVSERGSCLGFVTAVAEILADPFYGIGGKVCFPQGTTSVQLQAAFLKYLKDHPEVLRISAARLAVQALEQTFPCR